MSNESKLLGVSWRGWLAFFVIFTACWAVANQVPVPEWFVAVVSAWSGYYCGQKGVKVGP